MQLISNHFTLAFLGSPTKRATALNFDLTVFEDPPLYKVMASLVARQQPPRRLFSALNNLARSLTSTPAVRSAKPDQLKQVFCKDSFGVAKVHLHKLQKPRGKG